MIVRIVVLAAAVGLLVHTGGIATGEPPDPRTHTVTIDGFRFQPERLTVARGDRIVWVNKDVVPHTALPGPSSIHRRSWWGSPGR